MSFFHRWELIKYSPDQPRDERGRWTMGGSALPEAQSGEMSAVDKHIADFKRDRPLTGPDATRITALREGTRYVPYSETPFFSELNQLQGTPNPMAVSPKAYSEARAGVFASIAAGHAPLDGIVFTQPNVNLPRVKEVAADKSGLFTKPVEVVQYGSEYYLLNGHHRVAADLVNGRGEIAAKILKIPRQRAAA